MIIATPFGQPSLVPTAGAFVKMKGLIRGKVQEFDVELPEFAKKMGELFEEFPVPSTGILVRKTCFVMENGTQFGQQEHFDKPFLSIQQAMDSSGPDFERWCIVVYPGYYVGNLIVPSGLNLYFYGGAQIEGDITLGDGCNLQFESGTVVNGNITDGGNAVVANICGCLELNGLIELLAPGSLVNAEGESLYGVNAQEGTLNLYFHFMADTTDEILVGAGSGSFLNIFGLSINKTVGFTITVLANGNLSIRDSVIETTNGFGVSVVGASSTADIRDTKIRVTGNGIAGGGITGGLVLVDNCSVESISNYGISFSGNSIIRIRRSFITVANSTNVDQDAIIIEASDLLAIEGNTIIAKGVGNSVIGFAPVIIKSLIGNGSNAAVNANVTETISTIFVDVNYE